MWTVVVMIAGGGVVNLIYEHESKAKIAFDNLTEARKVDTCVAVSLSDDFGTKAEIGVTDITVHTLQDVKRVQIGAGELHLANMRANVTMQQKAQRDPTLKLFSGGMGMPPTLVS